MNLANRSTTTTAVDNRCHGLRCFRGKKGGQQALLKILQGHYPSLRRLEFFCMKYLSHGFGVGFSHIVTMERAVVT